MDVRVINWANLLHPKPDTRLIKDSDEHGYQNRSVETAQVIEALIEMAKKIREAANRGEQLALNEDELRFYGALANNERPASCASGARGRSARRWPCESVDKMP
jgi:type I site-specific restriction-modification system R (restriction) subunit